MGVIRFCSLFIAITAAAFAILTGIPGTPSHLSRLLFWKKQVNTQAGHAERARRILKDTPLIDGHNDFPILVRQQLHNQIYDHQFDQLALGSQTDFKKMETGMMGGQFWSVFMPCPAPASSLTEKEQLVHFNEPNWAVRDTLEQIDLVKRFVAAYPARLELCLEPGCVRRAHRTGKVASMIGVEGGHQTSDSLGALRTFYELGVRYLTLTHNCDNVFATAASTVAETGRDDGLTPFGRELMREMNRMGMMVDLSHVSFNTMRQALHVAAAPVIFSHSAAFAVQAHWRNVPDDVLEKIQINGGIVMVPVIPFFLNVTHPTSATVEDVVDHILHIASVAGWDHVGLGSDFDGTVHTSKGIEDISQWPNLIGRLLARGVNDAQARKLVGDNILRVWSEVERAAASISKFQRPNEEIWPGRTWEERADFVPQIFP